MCLLIKSGPHTARKDFYTIKMVEYPNENECYSFYQRFRYEYNKLYSTTIFAPENNAINEGFHSIQIGFKTDWLEGYFDSESKAIVLCKVVKGSKYYIGKDRDIVSNKIMVVEPIILSQNSISDLSKKLGFEYIGDHWKTETLWSYVKPIVESYGLNIELS